MNLAAYVAGVKKVRIRRGAPFGAAALIIMGETSDPLVIIEEFAYQQLLNAHIFQAGDLS